MARSAMGTKREIVDSVLDRHGATFAGELRIKLEKGTPSVLFRWLCASILFSARIGQGIAIDAAKGLREAGWTTAERLASSTWRQRVKVLNEAGYTRYQERTATMLGDTAEHALERYRGDLRRLREHAERDPDRERRLLKEFKGLGDVGVDIFFREAQIVWDELYPFADGYAIRVAKELGLGSDARAVARHVRGPDELTRLLSGLIRADAAGDADGIRAAARG